MEFITEFTGSTLDSDQHRQHVLFHVLNLNETETMPHLAQTSPVPVEVWSSPRLCEPPLSIYQY